MEDPKKQNNNIKDFEKMKNLAEIKALSNYSLENPLNDKQFNRMMELKNIFNINILKGGKK